MSFNLALISLHSRSRKVCECTTAAAPLLLSPQFLLLILEHLETVNRQLDVSNLILTAMKAVLDGFLF